MINPRDRTVDSSQFQAIVAAPGFSLGVRCSDAAVTGIDFFDACPEAAPTTALAAEAARQLRIWLADAGHRFDLPLRPSGTAFQRRVWAGISGIPRGQTRTYGELAAAIGSGPRAVGGACGANPYPVVVPCHRVVAADGGLGGFARERGGFLLDIKRWLLTHETN
jgi:methylated-DNA-[protein]-cysteine S-methyltransferase